MSKKVAILGSGLSGLLCAKALWENSIKNFDMITLDKTEPKLKGGFMLLHDNCGLSLEKEVIKVKQNGSERGYKEKLGYNKASSSWKSGLKEYYMVGYNPFQAVKVLHRAFYNHMVEGKVTPEDLDCLKDKYDIIISTIPPEFLFGEIEKESTQIWLVNRSVESKPNPCVTYHGDLSEVARSGQIWGHMFEEYTSKDYQGQADKIIKPIKADIPHQKIDDNIMLVGRNGLWNKNILAHNVYYKILERVKS